MKYVKGDIVTFKLSSLLKETYSGIILSSWTSTGRKNKFNIYKIASMNHGMADFTIGESCIIKKLS